VPSEKANHDDTDNQIEERVQWRHTAFGEEWKGGDLEGIGGDSYDPRGTVFGPLEGSEVGFEALELCKE